MNLVFILGKMVECMKVFIKKIRNMVTVSILGLIQRSMQAGGIMVNSMA
jgi:hypothetical protein